MDEQQLIWIIILCCSLKTPKRKKMAPQDKRTQSMFWKKNARAKVIHHLRRRRKKKAFEILIQHLKTIQWGRSSVRRYIDTLIEMQIAFISASSLNNNNNRHFIHYRPEPRLFFLFFIFLIHYSKVAHRHHRHGWIQKNSTPFFKKMYIYINKKKKIRIWKFCCCCFFFFLGHALCKALLKKNFSAHRTEHNNRRENSLIIDGKGKTFDYVKFFWKYIKRPRLLPPFLCYETSTISLENEKRENGWSYSIIQRAIIIIIFFGREK